MKLWFAKKGSKSPYDATVEQTLLYAQDVGSTTEPNPASTDLSAFTQLLREPATTLPASAAVPSPAKSGSKPMVSRAMREEMQHRIANYRAFQMKLNDDREIRMRKTLADMRARLQLMGKPDHPPTA